MSINEESCDTNSYYNWRRSGITGPGGIILEEDSTRVNRGLSVGQSSAEDVSLKRAEESSPNCGSSTGSLGQLHCRGSDCSFAEESSRDDDDPYEYDEDIPRRPLLLCRQENIQGSYSNDSTDLVESLQAIEAGSSNREDILVASGASTSSGITPCWGCKGCNPGTPLFVLGSPADAPSTCISCQ